MTRTPWLTVVLCVAALAAVVPARSGRADEPVAAPPTVVPVEANRKPEPQSPEAEPKRSVVPAPNAKASGPAAASSATTGPTWNDVATIVRAKCAGCHNDADREGDFSLSSFASLMAGTPKSPAMLPGRSGDSLIVRLATGAAEPKMPPEDEPPLTPAELATITAWIDAGAIGPDGSEPTLPLIVPTIPVPTDRPLPVTALAVSADRSTLAVGRYGRVELIDVATKAVRHTIDGLPGKVTTVQFALVATDPDGKVGPAPVLVVGSGIAGLSGQVSLWGADGSPVAAWEVGDDLPYAAAVAPDGRRIAVAGYDRIIRLIDPTGASSLRELTGHNGAVLALAFDAEGKTLASGSADNTVKLWRTADGERLDTMSQPLDEITGVLFAARGDRVLAVGRDRRLREWKYASRTKPAINPAGLVRFAHETPIVAVAATPDGRALVTASEAGEIKTWDGATLDQRAVVTPPGVPVSALVAGPDANEVTVGRFDGSWQTLPVPREEKAPASPSTESPRPEIVAAASMETPTRPAAVEEAEPNDAPTAAAVVTLPVTITGRIDAAARDAARQSALADGEGKAVSVAGVGSVDVDGFAFEAEAGSEWVIEVDAAKASSPLDSFVDVVTEDGEPILRERLQATRESYFTFRGKTSVQSDDFRVFGWEEMKVDEYLYSGGEVTRLWMAPWNTDSGFSVYPGKGSRHTFFDTSPVAHALGEPAYVVRPIGTAGPVVANGLPVFPVYYENDDDPRQMAGRDSRLTFVAPATGRYVVRIRDRRGFDGPEFKYALTIRPRRPDFAVTLAEKKLAVPPGSGRMFSLDIVRKDDFDGPVTVTFDGVPEGWVVTSPIVIEAGQWSAEGAVLATPVAAAPDAEALKKLGIRATATIGGREVGYDLPPFAEWTLAPAPKLLVRVLPDAAKDETASSLDGPTDAVKATGGAEPDGAAKADAAPAADPLVAAPWSVEMPTVTIRPGETITARAVVVRNGFDQRVELGKDEAGRNMPHGVFVDNIGLNGLLIVEGASQRQFFITADPIATPQERLVFLRANNAGGETSWPIRLRVMPAGDSD